jgi:hypothetical protein
MAPLAAGPFDVTVTPEDNDAPPELTALGRMTLAKRYHGDLDAGAAGTMLTAMSPTPGSALYVAVERVSGTLHGRRGTFALGHRGVMERGAQSLQITVVPDSGTDELTGIAGELRIRIEGKAHFYELQYTLEPGA